MAVRPASVYVEDLERRPASDSLRYVLYELAQRESRTGKHSGSHAHIDLYPYRIPAITV